MTIANHRLRLLLAGIFFLATLSLASEPWWSFQSPMAPVLPSVAAEHPIDGLIEERLARDGLSLSRQADRATLVRRVTLVMLGVPPVPEDVEAFVRDPTPIDALWPMLVDHVLADPRYGERWAQHWLDVIRWAETVGFETNAPRPHAWHYRDWVIKALNEDLPYDEFVFAQLAGDQVGDDAALGFLVAGPANLPGQVGRDEEAMRQARQDELDEVVRTVSQAFLGLTVGCARCHDHKFDPITAKDYYSLQTVFAGLRYGDRRLRGEANDRMQVQVPAVVKRLDHLERALELRRQEHGLREPLTSPQTEIFDPVLAQSIRMRIRATNNGQAASLYEVEAWTSGDSPSNVALASAGAVATASSFALENQTRHPDCLNDGSVDQRQAFPWRSASGGEAWLQIDFAAPALIDRVVWHEGFSLPVDHVIEVRSTANGAWREVTHTRDRLPHESDARTAIAPLSGLTQEQTNDLLAMIVEVRQTRACLSQLRAGPPVYAASFVDDPEATWLLNRGDPMQREREVEPAVPAVLGTLGLTTGTPEPERRLALARHLTQANHPLTARVMVNRVWQHHFGVGLVDTPSDFGKMGSKPSHPELLDLLASEFVRHGWSMKWLHRFILTSRTFRQANRPDPKAQQMDANARLLWRYPPRRVEAEVIRDAMLAVSGQLNRRAGGVGFDFFRQQGGLSDYHPHETFDADGWRRMVYARKIRMQAVDIFGAFDCPDAGQLKPRRTRSITPIQSLSLMNSPFANRQAGFFAERLRREAGERPADQVARAIELAFSRSGTPQEIERLAALAGAHGLDQVCRVLFNTSEFIALP